MPTLLRLRFLLVSGDLDLSSQLISSLACEGARNIEHRPNFHEAIRVVQDNFFECIIIDKNLGEGDGIVLAPVAKRLNPTSALFLITENNRWATIEAARELGFNAVFGKERPPEEISQTIAAILRASNNSFQSKLELLSMREREILKDISTGKRTLEIAATRHISEGTIKSHLSSIYRKLGVRNRVEAIAAIKG